MRRIEAAVLAAMAALASPAQAAYGPIPLQRDTSFGSDSVSRAELPPEFVPQRLHVASGGAIYSLAAEQAGAGEPTHYLTRRDGQGALDPGFGVGGTLVHDESAVAGTQLYRGVCDDAASGAVYLTGATEGEEGIIVRRLLADGTSDDAWGSAGLLSVPMAGAPQPYALGCLVQPDGKLVLVGSWSTADADQQGVVNRAFVARLTTAGGLDADFGDAGVFAFAPPVFGGEQRHYALTHLDRDASGTLYVAGHSTDSRGERELILGRVSAAGAFALPYGSAGSLNLPLGPLDEQVARLRLNAGGRVVVGLLHSPANGSAGYAVTAVRFTGRGDVDVTYGCAGFKSGPISFGALQPFAAAFDGLGRALFLGHETGAAAFESVVRTTGLPELGIGGSSGEEIAHGCPSNDGLMRNLGGGSPPAGLLVLFGLVAALRGLRRR